MSKMFVRSGPGGGMRHVQLLIEPTELARRLAEYKEALRVHAAAIAAAATKGKAAPEMAPPVEPEIPVTYQVVTTTGTAQRPSCDLQFEATSAMVPVTSLVTLMPVSIKGSTCAPVLFEGTRAELDDLITRAPMGSTEMWVDYNFRRKVMVFHGNVRLSALPEPPAIESRSHVRAAVVVTNEKRSSRPPSRSRESGTAAVPSAPRLPDQPA